MPSASPSPVKRASTERRSSATLLSSSSNKASAMQHKGPRPHVVTRHSRNVSHGKNLSKLNRVHSAANVTSEEKHHTRKRSGPITPQRSPTSPGTGPGPGPGLPKRNTSYGALARNNTSHTNLRKNQSASALGRNGLHHGGHKKIGLAPAPRPKHDNSKTGFFELGGPQSSDDEEENEWEDSATLSPELTRTNSKASTPKHRLTPEAERAPSSTQHTSQASNLRLALDRPASPPSANLGMNNTNRRSLPDLSRRPDLSLGHTTPPDPALLHHHGRAGRAPPAMSTVSAVAAPNLLRHESSRSFTHINHADAAPMHVTTAAGMAEGSSSMENGVSYFLHQTPSSGSKTPAASLPHIDSGSDGESAAFMSNYKPQRSESPEKAHTLNKARFFSVPSRTQQKLELQRRETMRQGSATPPASNLAYGGASSLSLHGRTGSRGGGGAPHSLTDGLKAHKMNYDTGVKHFLVVRRFRNPILESVQRLKDDDAINSTDPAGTPTTGASNKKNRPPSRRGLDQYHHLLQNHDGSANGSSNVGTSISPAAATAAATVARRPAEPKKPTPLFAPRSSTRGGAGAGVRFQVPSDPPESEIDIGITPAHDSPDGMMIGEFDDGMTPYEALMRRLWNSREVFDPGEVGIAR
ncbi:hypothetical protein DV736_g2382, partial [Chaetothyriales sp. CBS 134916]